MEREGRVGDGQSGELEWERGMGESAKSCLLVYKEGMFLSNTMVGGNSRVGGWRVRERDG